MEHFGAKIRTKYDRQKKRYQQYFQNSKGFIPAEHTVKSAVNQEILEQTVQDIDAYGVSAQLCKEGFSSGAEGE